MAYNLWQAGGELKPQPKEAAPPDGDKQFFAVPPPPPEVKIRTMKSDLEEMAKSGGGLPHFQTIKAPDLRRALGREAKPEKKIDWFWIVVPLLAAALIAGIVYFAYLNFGEGRGGGLPLGGSAPAADPGAPSPPTPRAPSFVHNSLLQKPADEFLAFVVPTSVESAAQLQTFGQRLELVIAGARAGSRFIELRVQDSSGRDLAIDEALALPDALVLPRDFLLQKFNPDPTVFVFRNASGVWPGFIFELKPGENWLFLKNDIARLEISPKIDNFFLRSPGNPAGVFEDAIVSGQPARKLLYSSGAGFFYGWFRGKIIFSASEDGLAEALSRL